MAPEIQNCLSCIPPEYQIKYLNDMHLQKPRSPVQASDSLGLDRFTEKLWDSPFTGCATASRPIPAIPFLNLLYINLNGEVVCIAVHGEVPIGFTDIVSRIQSAVDKPENWDSYGARQINIYPILKGLQVLSRIMQYNIPIPIVFPTTKGGIQFEWHMSHMDLEVEITPNGHVIACHEDFDKDFEWELDVTQDDTPLLQAAGMLVSLGTHP